MKDYRDRETTTAATTITTKTKTTTIGHALPT
jgi:hypothetical protein